MYLLDNPILNSRLLDAIGGVGRYTIPHRMLGMGLGVYGAHKLLGDRNSAATPLGVVGGYGAAYGIGKLIENQRSNTVNNIIKQKIREGSVFIPKNIPEYFNEVNKIKALLSASNPGFAHSHLYKNLESYLLSPGTTLLTDPTPTVFAPYKVLNNILEDKSGKLKNELLAEARKRNLTGTNIKMLEHMLLNAENKFAGKLRDLSRPVLLHEFIEADRLKDLSGSKGDLSEYFNTHNVYGNMTLPETNEKRFIATTHIDPSVVSDEMNINSRVMGAKERLAMNELRDLIGENDAWSTLLNRNKKILHHIPVEGFGDRNTIASNFAKAVRESIAGKPLKSFREMGADVTSPFIRKLENLGGHIRYTEDIGAKLLQDALQKAKKILRV